MTLHDIIRHDLKSRKPCHALSQKFYADRDMFNPDLDLIFYKDWIFAGHFGRQGCVNLLPLSRA